MILPGLDLLGWGGARLDERKLAVHVPVQRYGAGPVVAIICVDSGETVGQIQHERGRGAVFLPFRPCEPRVLDRALHLFGHIIGHLLRLCQRYPPRLRIHRPLDAAVGLLGKFVHRIVRRIHRHRPQAEQISGVGRSAQRR